MLKRYQRAKYPPTWRDSIKPPLSSFGASAAALAERRKEFPFLITGAAALLVQKKKNNVDCVRCNETHGQPHCRRKFFFPAMPPNKVQCMLMIRSIRRWRREADVRMCILQLSNFWYALWGNNFAKRGLLGDSSRGLQGKSLSGGTAESKSQNNQDSFHHRGKRKSVCCHNK
mmetsp:Transcript_2985/g.6099  ORF Transcript_2985/g.6099 Transcript_2985/m.6099 type:complete len:172 (+) Transcript_2985:1022-1537(+)